jgi:hypothetical protein
MNEEKISRKDAKIKPNSRKKAQKAQKSPNRG